MPTPMTPAKPIGPQTPKDADQQDLTQVDLNDPTVNPILKMQAMAAKAKNPGAFAKAGAQPGQGQMGGAGVKGFGEKPFSVVTKNDPNGEVHLYAKNQQDAKQKYQKLGNPLGSMVDAEEVAEGLPQTLRKVVPGHAKREIDKKMDAGKFGKTDADKDANFQRYKKIQDKIKEQGVAEGSFDNASPMTKDTIKQDKIRSLKNLIALAKEQGRQLRVQELELELKKLQGVAEAQTDYQKRRQRERDIDAGKPVKPAPKNPQNDYFARRKKEKLESIEEGFWDEVRTAGEKKLGFEPRKPAKKFDPDREENTPFSNYRKSWVTNNKKFGMGADEHKQDDSNKTYKPKADIKVKKNRQDEQPFYISTIKDRDGRTIIMAKTPEDAKAEWERKYGKTNDRIIKVMTAQEANIGESMTTTTLKTTFEGLEDTIAGLLEEYGLENGRDFYIDGTIRTVSEQVAQDILSVLSDFELPGQTNMRKLDEQFNISLIGQGEEPVESLRIGSDSVDIKHIGEGFVRVYVNNELAETFDNGSAAFKYVKALQENLAEAEQEIISAMTAEAGEDLMKISNITEGWDDMLKDVKSKSGPQPNGGAGVKKGKRYGGADQDDDAKEEAPKDADGNPVKRGRGRPKKVREGLDTIRKMRKQVAEALARIERLPEDQRNSVRVQSVVQALEESVRTAIKKAM